MKIQSTLLTVSAMTVAALVLLATPLAAHHAFSAEFDSNQPVHFTGVVKKVEFINPHSWIHVEVTNDDGSKTTWAIEGGSPNTLFRRGINKNSLPEGTQVVVDGYRSKDGSNKANGRDVTFPDGRKIFLGGSGAAEQPGR